jgi:membrane dipeptidase
MARMLIFDAHLDLSMNALEWNRDLTRPAAEIRRREEGMTDKVDRGNGTVTLPDMRRGRVGLCVATMIARSAPGKSLLKQLPGFSSPEIAWAMTQGQLSWYRAMEEAGEMTQIVDRRGLARHVNLWHEVGCSASTGPTDSESRGAHRAPYTPQKTPIGYILSLEGADSILTPKHLERAYAQGLRAVGPVHYGVGRYGHGTHATGGLTAIGRELLAEMRRLGIILDVTHLCDESFREALDCFDGPVWASHHNCRALVPGDRQLADEQIKTLIERGAVIGAALDAWMLAPGWQRGVSTPQETGVSLANVVDHIDHVCQIAGNARHAAIGTDLDGAFGREQSPKDIDTIADLAKVPSLLTKRGYCDEDVRGIMHGNWIRFLNNVWRN